MKTLEGKHQVIRNIVPAEGKARKKRRTNHSYKEIEMKRIFSGKINYLVVSMERGE